jgi:hypothetical protein
MTIGRFVYADAILDVSFDVPMDTLACVSSTGTLHLYRSGKYLTRCLRTAVARCAPLAEPVIGLKKHRAKRVCPYCLAWAMRAQGDNHAGTDGGLRLAWGKS